MFSRDTVESYIEIGRETSDWNSFRKKIIFIFKMAADIATKQI